MENKYKELFKFGGEIDNKTNVIISILGAIILIAIWHLLTYSGTIISHKILPTPESVLLGFRTLFIDEGILKEIVYSVRLNLLGYVYALIIAIPLGFIIGIYPLPKSLFQRYVDSIRYLPIPTISGIFITIFGLGFGMKASFLAFGILIYILPFVVQKVNDLQNPSNDKDYVYLQTIKTLGANNLQKFTKVYFPYVMGRVSTDIINITAVTWTYIVICELLNKEGGVGAMIYTLNRQSRIPEMYGALFIIILIGITQDFLLRKLDKLCFPYKYNDNAPSYSFIKNLFFQPKKEK